MKLCHEIRSVMRGKGWVTLNDLVLWLGSSNKSYVKITLFAMGDVEYRKVPLRGKSLPKSAFRWEFRLD